MAKSAINRHYNKVRYLRMINHPDYYSDGNLPISFGHNKRKISEFICPEDDYFAKRLIKYKRKKLESHWQDNVGELELNDDNSDTLLEYIITDNQNNYMYSYIY